MIVLKRQEESVNDEETNPRSLRAKQQQQQLIQSTLRVKSEQLTEANMAQFTVSVQMLRELMETRGHEAIQRIADDYGGVHELCK